MRAVVIMRRAAGCLTLTRMPGNERIDFSFSDKGAALEDTSVRVAKFICFFKFCIFFLPEIPRTRTLQISS
jgi:hypothetical protein